MKNSTDPSAHRACERRFIEHVERLLKDERLRIDTTRGRRPVTAFTGAPSRADRSVELKRMMTDMRVPDREVEAQMPTGESLELELKQAKMLVFTETVAKLRAMCLSPTKTLLKNETPEPMTKGELERQLGALPPTQGVPTTIVVLSTSGFTLEAHELAERRAERTLIMVEPNEAGGFSVFGPVETKALSDLFDPEAEDEKRRRVRDVIDASQGDLTGSGIATDRVMARTKLPLSLVEAELKEYAKQNRGLVAKRLDGRIVLFREGSVPITASTAPGGSTMPMIDRIKTLFARKGETEKKISFLSERRAALGQQRDRAYEEIAALEQKDSALVRQFKESNADVAKRRVTSQLVQLRKEMERRHQLLSVFNQQINVVSTHLHNLELVHQGKKAALPDSEEMASDAAKAEEMLASLQANTELAESVGTSLQGGLSAEEQALYAELSGTSSIPGATTGRTPSPPRAVDASDASDVEPSESVSSRSASRRADPEAG